MARRHSFLRALGWLGKLLLGLVIFVLMALDVAFIALELPVGQRLVLDRVNRLLASQFRGTLRLDSVRDVDFAGARGVQATLFDPEGREIAQLRGVDSTIDLFALLESLVKKGPLRVHVRTAEIADGAVLLVTDARDELTIATSFEPRNPRPEHAEPGTEVDFELRSLRIHHNWVRGAIGEVPVDADLTELDAALGYDPRGFSLDVTRARLAARGLPQAADPEGVVSGTLLAPEAGGVEAAVEFDGKARGVPLVLAARLANDGLAARLEVPHADPGAVHELIPELMPRDPARAVVVLAGSWQKADFSAELATGKSELSVSGDAQLKPRFELGAKLSAKALDLEALHPELPALRSDAVATVALRKSPGRRLEGDLNLATRRLTLGGKRFPDALLDADLRDDVVSGTLRLPAAGPDNHLNFRVAGLFDHGALDVHASARVKLEDLRKVAALPPDLRGTGSGWVRGRIDRKRRVVDASVAGEFAQLFVADTSARRGVFEADVTGPLDNPRLSLKARFDGVARPHLELERVDVDANGPLTQTRLRVEAREAKGRYLSARADVDLSRQIARNIDVDVKDGGVGLRAQAKSVALRDRGVVVDRMRIEGAGDLELSVRALPGATLIQGKGRDVNLGRIARLLGVETRIASGGASFDVDLRVAGRNIDGRANARIQRALIGGIGPVDASLDFESAAGKIDAEATVSMKPALDLTFRADALRFGNPGPSLAGLKRASGHIELDASADLGELPEHVLELLPVGRARGKLRLALDAARRDPAASADLRLYMDSAGLELEGESSAAPIQDREEAIRRKPWRLAELDANVELRVVGGNANSSLLAMIRDRRGSLIDLQAAAPLTLEDVLAGGLRERIADLPVEARVAVPRRKLSDLPALLRPTYVAGTLALEAETRGPLSNPNLGLDFRVDDLRSKDPNRRFSLDFRTRARYVEHHAEVVLEASNRGQPLAQVRAWGDGKLADFARGENFVASGRALLRGVPLAALPILRERQVRGKLFGDVAIDDIGKDGKARASLSTRDLKFGALTVQGAKLDLRAENGQLHAKANIDHTGGYARADIDSGILWGQRPMLEIDNTRPLDAKIKAKDFRAAVLLPFVHDIFSELDGKLNADLHFRKTEGKTEVLGKADFDDGTLQVPAVGQEFRRVHARARAEPGGVLKIDDATAHALTGKIRAAAAARFEGLSLQAMNAKVQVAQKNQVPVTSQGVVLGEAWGTADMNLRREPERNTTRVAIKVPSFHLELTQVARSELQQLDDPERVHIGVQLDAGKFRALPLQPLHESPDRESRLVFDIELGNDVWVRRGTTVRAKLSGRLKVSVQERILARGQIELSKGMIDVQGKRFEVERGIITFKNEDPSNPLVVATARWDSPDGFRVFADYTGRAKNGKLTLRSEPPLSQDEILSLLLFGAPDGSFGVETGVPGQPGTEESGKGQEAALAVGVAGGAATQGLNRAIGDLTTLDVTTRVDTTYGDPRPQVVVQLTRRLAAQLSYAVGDPPPGQTPDRTFLTLDLRLGTRWSLATTFGDRGASMLDLLWRYRY